MTEERVAAYRVAGRVQGVGFRWSTRTRAQELGLAGTVENEPAGTVLVVLRGEAEAVAAMRRWLDHGPPAARVTEVVAVPVPGGVEPGAGTSFRILR